MSNKELLIDFLVNNGKGTLTWLDLANRFDIKPNKSDIKRAKATNDIWRAYQRKCEKFSCTPDCATTGCSPFGASQGILPKVKEVSPADIPDGMRVSKKNSETNLEIEVPEGMKISKKWQGASGKWLYSFAADKKIDSENKLNEFRKNLIEDIKNLAPNVNPTSISEINPNKPTIAYELNLSDLHIGRQGGNETKTLYLSLVSDLIGRVKNNYNIERIILSIGGDLLNSDTLTPGGYTSTTRGTPQKDVDSLEQTFRTAWTMLVEAIKYLETIAPVYVIMVRGNHDYYRSFYVADVVSAYFHNNKNVYVDNSESPFKLHQYGSNFIGYHHGDKVKIGDFPLIFATTFPEEFASCEHKVINLAHLHKRMQDEVRGIQIKHMPSPAGNSKWEENSGYKHRRRVIGTMFHSSAGVIGEQQINIKS